MWRNRRFGWMGVSGRALLLLLTLSVTGLAQQETWTSGDVGSPALAGSSSYNPANDTFTVKGAGTDIWGTADQFQFVYQAVSGNCELVARVVTLQNTNGWAKAGLMLREDLTGGAKNALVAATVSNGVTYQWRYTAGGGSAFASGGTGVAPVWVKLKRLGDQVTYYRSADGQTWTQIGTQNIAMNSTVYAGLAVTSHNTGALATATFDHVSLTASGIGTLPSPWNDADIGTPGYRGYAVFDGTSTFSVAGGGADIWGTADAFHFLYQPLVGDGAVQARILTQQNTNAWAKAGGMIRESLAADSKHGMSILSSNYGMLYQGRNTTGGTSIGLPTLSATIPIWTKMERRGPVLIGWKSLDGATWDWVGSQPVSMGTQAFAGLAVTAHNNAALSLATFDNLQVTAGRDNSLPTPWNEVMLGSPALGGWAGFANNTFSIYAGGGDTWNAADQGEFVYRPLNGDGTITLKVANLKNSQEWAKAGVMMRETLSPDAKHVLWGVSPSHGVLLQKRVTTGTTPSNYYDSATVAPVWLKLQRTGNIFTASKSSDGTTWTIFGTETVPMDANIYAGAVLSSPNTTVIGQADIPTLTMAVPSAHNYTPLAWWPMNEGSGTTLVDASGGQHDATVSGTLVRASGHNGSGGINLPSGDATAYVTTQTLMSGTSSLSISAWFKTTDSGVRRIISKGHWGATTGFLLGIGHSAPGRLTFGIGGGGTAAESVLMSTTESFNNGAWHHVVGVYDSAAHTARIYVDGTLRNVALTGPIWGGTIIEAGKALDTSALTQLSTTSNIALHVGSYNGQYERWIGELDDVRLYATVLDDLDVLNLYADDGLPVSWKQRIVDFSSTDSITSIAQVLPGDDFDGDGLTNLQEYQQGTDPTDYYNGQLPTLTLVSGGGLSGPGGVLISTPVVVKTANSSGAALANAPVTFQAITSGAGLSASSNGSIVTTQTVHTGADGTASIYVSPSATGGLNSQFQATATTTGQTQTLVFTAARPPIANTVQVAPMIAGGGYYTLALRSDGTLWAWGSNSEAEFGNGTTTSSLTPIKVNNNLDGHIVAVAAGAAHSMALTDDGKVWTWGGNYYGEIGDGTESGDDSIPFILNKRVSPGRVNGLDETVDDPVVAIAAGSYYSLALKKGGTVWEWGVQIGPEGDNHLEASQVKFADGTPLTDIVAISAEAYHALAVKDGGTVWAWGQNASGELGNGTNITTGSPVQVLKADGSPLTGITDVRAGRYFSIALDKNSGKVWTWGYVWGTASSESSRYAVPVSGFGSENPAIAIEAKDDFSLALTGDGRVWTWGANYIGELGNGTILLGNYSTPTRPASIINDIVGISSGGSSGFAFDKDGRIWSWGASWMSGFEGAIRTMLPAVVTTDINGQPFGDVKELSLNSGGDICMALKNDGSVWLAGRSTYADLADKTNIATALFFQVPGIPNITKVSFGQTYALAIDDSQNVWTWGDDISFNGSSFGPAKIKNSSGQILGNITSIAAGRVHALALDGSGHVWAWGYNYAGQVGNGNQNSGAVSVTQVLDVSGQPFANVVEISGGGNFSLARQSDGSVWTWGAGTTHPTKISSLSNIIAISAGDAHSVALDSNHGVWTWGDNSAGQMGSTAVGQSSVSTPVQISQFNAGAQVVSVRAYKGFSLALRSDGTVWGWGKVPQKLGVTQSTVPFQLEGYEGIKALANTSNPNACAIQDDGSLIISGQNSYGVGGVISAPSPLLINGLNLLVDSPQVTITSPSASATAAWSAPISIQTSSADGQIGKVDFYNEGEWIGSSTTSSFVWQPPTWGTYHIRAIATNTDGLTSGYSNSVELTVPYDPTWNNPSSGGTGDPNTDSDGDGVTNTQENTAGTDPNQKDNPALNLNVNVILK